MDPLTHFSAGVIIGSCFSSGTALPLTCGFISLINDADFIFKWVRNSRFYFLHHHVFHSLPAVLILAMFSSVIISAIFSIKFLHSFMLCLILYLAHVLLDLLVLGGDIKIFFPFSHRLLSIPIFSSLSPVIKNSKCAFKSPSVCLLCQSEIMIRSPFRVFMLISAFLVLFDRRFMFLIAVPLIIIIINGIFYGAVLKYIQKKHQAYAYIAPVSIFPVIYNAVLKMQDKIIIHKLKVKLFEIEELGKTEIYNNDHSHLYDDVLKRDRNIASFIGSHPVLCLKETIRGCDTLLEIFDPRFYFNDGNQYFVYKIKLREEEIIESEFREKWSVD